MEIIFTYLIFGLIFGLLSLSIEWDKPTSATFIARWFALILFGWGLIVIFLH